MQSFSLLIHCSSFTKLLFVLTMFNCNALQKILLCFLRSLVLVFWYSKFSHLWVSFAGGTSEKAGLLLFTLLFKAMHPLPSVTNVKSTTANSSLWNFKCKPLHKNKIYHYQWSIDFNTVNTHRSVGVYFLVSTGNRDDIEWHDLQRYNIQYTLHTGKMA